MRSVALFLSHIAFLALALALAILQAQAQQSVLRVTPQSNLNILDPVWTSAFVWGDAQRLRMDLGSPLPPCWQPDYDRRVAAARSALGDDAAFNRAWQDGRTLTFDQAMDLALAPTGE